MDPHHHFFAGLDARYAGTQTSLTEELTTAFFSVAGPGDLDTYFITSSFPSRGQEGPARLSRAWLIAG
jgi:hypothetical protein